MEVRWSELQALRQTSTIINVIEKIQEFSSDEIYLVLRCIDLRDLLAVVLVYVLSECARYPAKVQCLL